MQIKLIAKSTPNIEADTAEKFSVYIARVTSEREDKTEEYEKLISYLIRNEHWSPFEHFYYTFEISTTRAIGRQLLRHRSFTFQEYSQRYGTDIEIELPELRKKAKTNRQGSIEETAQYNFLPEQLRTTKAMYDKMISEGIAPECARMILPECTKTTVCMTGNIRSWIHFLRSRLDSHAQKEIREIAKEIKSLLEPELPLVMKLVESNEER
jgi:thymidylate synthase (FAD)